MEKKTLCKISENKKCMLTLNSIKLNTTMTVTNLNIDSDIFYRLVFLTPTSQSRYGIKFKKLKKLNRRTTDIFLRTIFAKLEISDNSIMIFKSFDGKKGERIESKNLEELSGKPFILLRNENDIKCSLFGSIRNCLAHGNIIKDGDWFYLFALSNGQSKTSDENKKLKFLLKIKNLNLLTVFCNILDEYN